MPIYVKKNLCNTSHAFKKIYNLVSMIIICVCECPELKETEARLQLVVRTSELHN